MFASGEAFEFEFGVTKVDEQSNLDAGRVQIIDDLGFMLRGESFHRFEFDDHLFFNQEISIKFTNRLLPKTYFEGLLRLSGQTCVRKRKGIIKNG